MLEFMQKGGPLMWPLLVCSIFALGAFLERVSALHRATIEVGELLQGLANLIHLRRYDEALRECASTPGPVARVLYAAIRKHDAPRSELRDVVQEAGQLEVPRLERNLTFLSSIAQIAPLLGLLGTLLGMTQVFLSMSAHGGYATASDISTGIYQALFSATAGLVIAIPTQAAYYFISSKVNQLIHDMERGGIEIVRILRDSPTDEKEGKKEGRP